MSIRNLEPMLEMYLFESNQLIEQLEEILLRSEKTSTISKEDIDEIFRIMHTIKGSSAMMMFSNISSMAHYVEDLFFYIREGNPQSIDYSILCDLVLASLDFIQAELRKIEEGKAVDGNEQELCDKIGEYLSQLKGGIGLAETQKKESKENQRYYISKYEIQEKTEYKYSAKIHFEHDCQMENIRAFTLVHNLKEFCNEIYHEPQELFENEAAIAHIVENGFFVYFSSELPYEEIQKHLQDALFVNTLELEQIDDFKEILPIQETNEEVKTVESLKAEKVDIEEVQDSLKGVKQSIISVNIQKLDKLMDLVGEIVITESMVIRNPDLEGLKLDNFSKAARQLRKLTDELQDVVMSIRMVPIGPTFHKMQRIVRDMAKKVGKEVELIIEGEETEVDKNIIDHLGDPLMHLIRNAIDHGIEATEDRLNKAKSKEGKIYLQASNTGGDVIISIKDDGKGLDRETIIRKARQKNLITKLDAEISDREAFSLILLPGFSTKENVTEFSGRGVGMDVVKRNIEKVGGNISIESILGEGMNINIKIPLTLAIIDGMQIATGKSLYTIPTVAIKESFRANPNDLIVDTDGNEMIMIRGNCYPIVRIHKYFNVQSKTTDLSQGIMVMVEGDNKGLCLYADELLGEQQVVVKPLPNYLLKYPVKRRGIGGCTILGDGGISLILDVMGIIDQTI